MLICTWNAGIKTIKSNICYEYVLWCECSRTYWKFTNKNEYANNWWVLFSEICDITKKRYFTYLIFFTSNYKQNRNEILLTIVTFFIIYGWYAPGRCVSCGFAFTYVNYDHCDKKLYTKNLTWRTHLLVCTYVWFYLMLVKTHYFMKRYTHLWIETILNGIFYFVR